MASRRQACQRVDSGPDLPLAERYHHHRRSGHNLVGKSTQRGVSSTKPTRIGHTSDGQPIYPIVGYTLTPTCNRGPRCWMAAGVRRHQPMAVVALIMG